MSRLTVDLALGRTLSVCQLICGVSSKFHSHQLTGSFAFDWWTSADNEGDSPNAVHLHPPSLPGQGPPQGPPGAISPDAPGPIKAISVSQLNDIYLQKNQDVSNR